MKLNFNQIKDLTVGAVKVWEEKGLVCFSKCTQRQIERWEELRDDLGVNARATTGVKLDFVTNSAFVECDVANGNQFEVKINGVLQQAFFYEDTSENTFRVELDNSNGCNRVEIILTSHHYASKIARVELSDGAIFKRSQFDLKMLIMGDSITQGWRTKYNCGSYGAIVSSYFNAESVIQGVGGGFFEKGLVDNIGFTPDLIIVAFGTNDYGRYKTFDEVEIKMSAFFEELNEQYKDSKIIYVSPIWRTDEYQEREMGTFNECTKKMQTIAKNHGAFVVDGAKMLMKREEFLADGIHPNDLGSCCYALNLIKEISPFIHSLKSR